MKLRNDKEINAFFASAHSPTEPTEVSGREYSPTDCTDTHRLGEPTKLSSHRSFCEFGEFCGRTTEGGVGMAGMPYPPTKTPTDCTYVHRLGATNAT